MEDGKILPIVVQALWIRAKTWKLFLAHRTWNFRVLWGGKYWAEMYVDYREREKTKGIEKELEQSQASQTTRVED